MDSSRVKLIKGAYKSAAAALGGTTIGTSIMAHFSAGIDPTQWNVTTWIGVKHNLVLGASIVLVAELRYAKQWLDRWSDSEGAAQPGPLKP